MARYRSAKAVLEDCNTLAGGFYQLTGNVVPDGYRFDLATHPAEKLCWDQAVMAYEFIQGTDMHDVLIEVEEEEAAGR